VLKFRPKEQRMARKKQMSAPSGMELAVKDLSKGRSQEGKGGLGNLQGARLPPLKQKGESNRRLLDRKRWSYKKK